MHTRFTILFILLFSGCFSSSVFAQSESDTLQDSTQTLTLGYYNSPPFITENENGELEGIVVWLWGKIVEDLNISYELKKMPLAKVLDNLEQGNVDITINPLTVTSERSTRVDFSHPYYVAHSTVAIRQSSTWEKSLLFMYSFLSFDFLQAIFALFLVVLFFGVLVWVFERNKNPDEFQSGLKGIASGIWWSAVTMTTVGYGDKSPRSLGGRIVALIWMFAAIIMISGFTASIASSLTVNQLGWEKSNIEDFKESVVGTVDGSATESWLRKKFFKKIKTFSSVPEGLQALNNGKVEGFVYDEPLLIYLINQDEKYEALETLPIHFNLQFYSFAFSKQLDNVLQEQISQKIIELTESQDWIIVLSEYDLTLK